MRRSAPSGRLGVRAGRPARWVLAGEIVCGNPGPPPLAVPNRPAAQRISDCAETALRSLLAHRLRSVLAAASMTVAVSTVALVYCVAATGRAYVLAQIEGVGSNLIYAYYEAGGNVSASEADYINLRDVEAVRQRLGSLARAVSAVSSTWDRIYSGGRPLEIRILGSDDSYRQVRNLVVREGRFLDHSDIESRAKVAMVTPHLANQLFGSDSHVVGRSIKAHGLEFRIVGVFDEGVETFGQSEVSENSVLIPYTVLSYFQAVERVDPLYVSVRHQDQVDDVAGLVRQTLEARHRDGSLYRVETMEGVVSAASRIMASMTVAMTLVASLTLAVSGVFIMNLMLIAVSERTAEIGVRRSIGATRRDIGAQFLAEAMILAGAGGAVGAAAGIVLPTIASQVWPALPVHVPYGWTAGVLFLALVIGGVFGLLPAAKAAGMAPAEALRNE